MNISATRLCLTSMAASLFLRAVAASGAETVAPANERILQQELKQQQIRGTTKRVKEQLGKKTDGRQQNSFSEEQQNSLRLLQIDQEPIKDEVLPVIGKLEKLAKEINDGPTAERPKAALQQIKEGGLLLSLDAAVEDL